MEQQSTILEGFSAEEKAAYLGAIASVATADRSASEEELAFLDALSRSANLSEDEANAVRQTASSQMTDEELKSYLDVLKNSELRFSFVTDVIAMAQADQDYSDEEKQNVQGIAEYLGVNQEQFSVLDQFTKKAVQEAPNQSEELESANASPQGFLDKLGFGDKLKGAGINTSSLMKGAIGILGPLLLSKMMGGRNRSSGGGGLLGGSGGGLLGGLLGGAGGGLLGGSGGGLLGGLLGGGGSSGGSFGNAGGMLGRILGGLKKGF
ncbi:MAG: TerB family tellurite resistance protein [Bacteroidota bacterium]